MSGLLLLLGLRRRHRHVWDFSNVYSGAAATVSVRSCACGEEQRSLTPAGEQQAGWWVELGLGHQEARDGVLAGTLPYPMRWRDQRWHLEDTRGGA